MLPGYVRPSWFLLGDWSAGKLKTSQYFDFSLRRNAECSLGCVLVIIWESNEGCVPVYHRKVTILAKKSCYISSPYIIGNKDLLFRGNNMQRNSQCGCCCCCFRSLVQCLISLVVVIFLLFVFGVRRRDNMSLLDSVAPLRFWWSKGTVQYRGFFLSTVAICRISSSLSFYNPQGNQNGYERFFLGKILVWFKNVWARILCMWFWSFFLECSNVCWLVLKCGCEFCVCK